MSEIIGSLIQQTGLGEATVRRLMNGAPVRYKRFYIPKRNGELRLISQPAREIKMLQRAVRTIFLDRLPVHEAATAYRIGVGLVENARPHKGDGNIVKMDFSDFFRSIKANDWIGYCHQTSCLTDMEEINLIMRLLFSSKTGLPGLRLAVGAPTSPILSNILMYDFDSRIYEKLIGTKIKFTRYADDLTFSAPRAGYIHEVHKLVKEVITEIKYPRLTLNPDKTTHVTKKYARKITGLILSDDGRVTIGREKKHQLRAMIHHASTDRLNVKNLQHLSGLLAYVNAVEPDYFLELEAKYGRDLLQRIGLYSSIRKGKGPF